MSKKDQNFPIFVNRRKYEVSEECMAGREILVLAGLGEGYDLLQLQGEGDPTGGDCVLADQKVDLKPGMHFRAVPGNCTFGDIACEADVPPLLRDNARDLSSMLDRVVTLDRDGPSKVVVVVEKAEIRPGGMYSVAVSDVMMLTDMQYPMSSIDMFYMEEHVGYVGRPTPKYASVVEAHAGRQWRRWSWHRNGLWTPQADGIVSHWAFVEACWEREASGESPRS